MYNKSSVNINNNEMEEITIKLESDSFEKLLFYRDEGNMNVVVSLFARDNDEKLVIRFKKVPLEEKVRNSIYSDKKNELMSFVHYEELLQNYFKNSDQFTVVPKIVFLDVDVHALNVFLMRDRPATRLSKVIGGNYGLLYRDVAFLPKEILGKSSSVNFKSSPTICLEIKAKQGYLMDDCERPFGVGKCRFCYFQYLKLKNHKIDAISSYCPLDLFSGNDERANTAIKSLLCNPQNNLKLFYDGKMIYNEYLFNKHSLHKLFASLFPETQSSKRQEILFVNLIRKVLMKDFKRCDSTVDVSCIKRNVDNIHNRGCSRKPDAPLPENCILNSVLQAQLLVKNNFSKMDILDSSEPIGCNEESNETILQNYKVGSTALDCSIMITLQRIPPSDEGCDDLNGSTFNKNHLVTVADSESVQHFIVNPTIVDLDMKKDSLDHFRKYKKQYNDSKLAFKDFMAKKRDQTGCMN